MRLALVAILCLAASPSPAEPPSSAPASTVEPTRPRVALALSGGGARGIAHVGALRALEEAGIPVDAIAANSMGAVVGGIYATGRTSAELEQIVRSMDWASLFSGKPDRQTVPVANRNDRYASVVGLNFDWKKMRLPAALLAEHRINRFLIENLSAGGYAAAGEFDRLPIPFHPIAGDLATGDPVVLTKGDLALAVRASMSIPVVFPPVDWEGKKLVDGLIVNNLPIDVAKAFGAEVLVAVDIGSPPLGPERYESALGVAAKVTDLLARRRYLDFAAAADVLVRPDLGDHSASDYSGFDELIKQGYEATKASLPAIRAKLLEAGIAVLAPRPKEGSGPVLEGTRIAAVRILGNERVSEGLARRTFNIPVDRGYSMERGVRAFDKIAASELFDRTWLAFAPVLEGVDVLLRVKEAPPNRAEVGLGYTEWEKARGSIRLRNQNTLGFGEQVELLLGASDAERIVEASLRGERLFVTGFGYRVAGYADRDKPRFFDAEGDEINRALFDRDGVDLALRTSRKRWGLIEGGVRFGRVKTHPEGGLENLLPEADDRQGAVFGSAVIDTLDDLAWPEHGQRFALFGDWSLADLGADLEYWRARAEYRGSRHLGERCVAELDGVAGFSGKPVPVYDWYRLGGVALVPGYHHEELKGPQELAAALSLRYRLFGQLRVVARGGAGNVFASTDDITLNGLRWGVGLGVYHPSPIGPVSIEVDVRDGGSVLAALSVGWN